MIQKQTWKDEIRILITDEENHGSVQISIPKLHRTLNIKYLRDMDKNLKDALYVEHNGRIGVLSSDENKVVS